ncbi:MAG: hypothetical protein AAFU79_16620 [Myxococcota bacterium]
MILVIGHRRDDAPAPTCHSPGVSRLALPVAALLGALGLSPVAYAQTVTITPSQGFDDAAAQLGLDPSAFEQQLSDEVAALYGLLDVAEFLRLSANAQTLVLAGSGADYASNPDGFFAGFGVNAALSAGDADLQTLSNELANYDVERGIPVSGGAMLTLMAGYNFARQGLPNLTVSVHGLHFPLSYEQLDGEFTNLGAHIQVKLFRQSKGDAFTPLYWGGIDLTGGFTYARTTLTLNDVYEADTSLSSDLRLNTVSTGTLQLEQTAYTIPLEITSNLTFFEVLTLFGGLGLDIPLGDASSLMDLDTSLVAASGDNVFDVGTAQLNVDDVVQADDLLPRVMVGLQVNVWILRLFAQLNISLRDTTLGAATGLRVHF